jgi:hypothetical protein
MDLMRAKGAKGTKGFRISDGGFRMWDVPPSEIRNPTSEIPSCNKSVVSCFFDKLLGEVIPLLVRRGGRDIKKMLRSHLDGADGVVTHRQRFGMRFETRLVSDHHVCAASVASQHLFTGAATPPHEEGNMPVHY